MGIRKDQVKYLSLEGGGGAGNGYMGALKALGELGILKYDNNYRLNINETDGDAKNRLAGASAGAITSAIMGCGNTPMEIETIMDKSDFEKFLDIGDEGEVPVIGGFKISSKVNSNRNKNEVYLLEIIKRVLLMQQSNTLSPVNLVINIIFNSKDILTSILRQISIEELNVYLTTPLLLAKFLTDFKPNVINLLLKNIDKVSKGIIDNQGVFVGKKPRIFIQNLINYAKMRVLFPDIYLKKIEEIKLKREQTTTDCNNLVDNDDVISDLFCIIHKYTLIEPEEEYILNQIAECKDEKLSNIPFDFFKSKGINYDTKGTTFAEYKKIFQSDLFITGTNLETKKSEIFSADTTPNFYVEDAVRISMSLPMIYKPFVIRDIKPDFLNGVWVDGGYLNNSPMDLFDSSKTLGLRLEQFSGNFQEERENINSILDFLKIYPFISGIFGTGESHISETMTQLKKFNYIPLNTRLSDWTKDNKREIGLFDFKSPIFKEVNVNTYNVVKKYFAP